MSDTEDRDQIAQVEVEQIAQHLSNTDCDNQEATR